MFVNVIPYTKDKRKMLVIQDRYKDENGKTRTKTIEKIGFIDELEKIYPDPIAHFKAVAKEKTKSLKNLANDNMMNFSIQKDGLMPFDVMDEYDLRLKLGNAPIAWVINKLQLDKFIDTRRKNLDLRFNLSSLFRLLCYERILSPSSKKRDWENRKRYYEKMDFELRDVYTGLQQIANWKESMIKHLNKKMQELYKRTYGLGFFDGTNVYYEIEDEDDFRKRGASKENRALPLTQIGVLLDSNGFPMSYDLYSGNTHDSLMLRPAMNRVREDFGLKHMIYVADSGFYAGDSIADVILNHDGYIISNSIRRKIDPNIKKNALTEEGYRYFDSTGKEQTHFDNDTIYKFKIINVSSTANVRNTEGIKHQVKGIGRYVISFWSKKYDERAKIDRMKTVEKALVKSHSRSKSKVANTYGSNKYLKTEVSTKDGNVVKDYKAKVKFDQKALDNDELLDGYYLIETNLAGKDWFDDNWEFEEGEVSRWRKDCGMLQLNRTLEPEDIIDMYRGLWKIEDTFRVMKSNLAMRPVYVSNRDSIEGHFLICFLCLLIIRILEQETGHTFTTEYLINSLRKAEVAEVNPGKYVNLYYDKVLKVISENLNLNLNQKAYTQQDIRKLFASTRKNK